MRWIVLAGVVGGGVFFFVLRGPSGVEPISFRTAKIDRGPVEETVTATGALAAVVTVQVGSQVSGTILKLGADFNSQVKEGQIIAQLDPTRFRANVAQAEAALGSAQAAAARARVTAAQAKLELDRVKELHGRGVVGQAELDMARSKHEQTQAEVGASDAQVSQARAAVGIARVDLERTTIKAPISGTVLNRAVDVGQTVAASLSAPTLFTIAQDLSQMQVKAAVDEADVGKLKEGQEARFSVDAYPGQDFTAKIAQIRAQPTVQQNIVTYDAILRVANPDGRLRPGMTATVRVVCQRRENVLRVPNAALRFKPAQELIESSGDWPPGKGAAIAAGAPGRPDAQRGGGPGARGGDERRPPRGGDGAEGGGGAPDRAKQPGVRTSARVFRAKGTKVLVVPFKPGIADDEYTEILSGPLREGDEVVVDAVGGPQRPSPGANPMRGRGPRMF